MELKKNPKKDLNKKSGQYFLFGLLMVLMLVFIALEWKSYDTLDDYDVALNNIDDPITEDVPVFELEAIPPPALPVVPTKIEVVENEDSIIETIIETSESSQDTQIMEVSDIVVEEVEEEVNVNWVTIEEVPIFPGCEKEEDKRACFNKMIQKHIRKISDIQKWPKNLGWKEE